MEAIAIIGMACRFPGAGNPETFWQLLQQGGDAIATVPPERREFHALYNLSPITQGRLPWGGFLKEVDKFDPQFFDISEREAKSMDPQQRLLLEVAWESLENSGIATDSLAGSHTGVFIGISNYDYNRLMSHDYTCIDEYAAIGTTLCITANRLSYLLNLRGPSLTVDTACSSSLVAVHLACQSLQTGESNLALAGGVNLILSPEVTISFSQAGLLAVDGRCKTFDASADGYVRSEGCGVIVLKRLSDALRDRDNIFAVIQGSAVNHNGLSNGLTAPNGPAQQAVIRRALENALVSPSQISYVEAHGTATYLGDSIEFSSLKTVLMSGRSPRERCGIGSVKTNIGHAESAAGIASLLKVVLCLQKGQIPPNLHLKELNPNISLQNTPFFIPTEHQPWVTNGEQRFAGVSAFGAGGTNAHVILTESPVPKPTVNDSERPLHLLTLSAKSEQALQELAQRYAVYLATSKEVSAPDICFTANTGRSHFPYRLAIISDSTVRLREQLASFKVEQEVPGMQYRYVPKRRPSKVVFVFSEHTSSYIGLGQKLYNTQPTFRNAINECDILLKPYLGQSLQSVLYPELEVPSPFKELVYEQLALFAVEYALAQLWQSWGIKPNVMIGQGVGEYVAACIAGVFSLEDGLQLVVKRSTNTGTANQNEYEQTAKKIKYLLPQTKLISASTGQWIDKQTIAHPCYWLSPNRENTEFTPAIRTLCEQGYQLFIQLGLHQTTLNTEQQILLQSIDWLPSLSCEHDDWKQMLQSLANLYLQGVTVDWGGFDRDYQRHRVALPNYPFQRQQCWFETGRIDSFTKVTV